MKYLRYVEPLEDLYPTYEPTELRLIQANIIQTNNDYTIYFIVIPIIIFIFAASCCYRCLRAEGDCV